MGEVLRQFEHEFAESEQAKLALRWGGADGIMPEATPKNARQAIRAAVESAKMLKDHLETATHLLSELAYKEKTWWLVRSLGYSHAAEDIARSSLRTCCILQDNIDSTLASLIRRDKEAGNA